MATSKITIEQYIGFEKKKETKAKVKVPVGKIVSFVILAAFCFIWVLPFIIMFFGSLRGYIDNQLYPDELFYPHSGYTFENYNILLKGEYPDGLVHNTTQDYTIGRWFLNSCFSAIGGTALYLFVASLAAYAFTFIPFKYSNVLFTILVFSMVIPGAATSVGNQMIVFGTGLNESLLALIIPGLGGVYGMYLIKTFFSGIPKDLIESAKMDGYSNFKIYLKIVLPLGKTVLLVQGLFGFMGGWNDLIWPQMLYGVKDTNMWTLQVGMAYVINNSKSVSLIGTALAGGVICLAPVFVMYLFAQRYIIEGMASAGIKG
jgi:multiple sugar transport system permease protein